MQSMLATLRSTCMNALLDTNRNRHPYTNITALHLNKHNATMPACLLEQFDMLAKCNSKIDCLIKDMLLPTTVAVATKGVLHDVHSVASHTLRKLGIGVLLMHDQFPE